MFNDNVVFLNFGTSTLDINFGYKKMQGNQILCGAT